MRIPYLLLVLPLLSSAFLALPAMPQSSLIDGYNKQKSKENQQEASLEHHCRMVIKHGEKVGESGQHATPYVYAVKVEGGDISFFSAGIWRSSQWDPLKCRMHTYKKLPKMIDPFDGEPIFAVYYDEPAIFLGKEYDEKGYTYVVNKEGRTYFVYARKNATGKMFKYKLAR